MRRPGAAPFQWAHAALSGRVIVPLAGKAAEGYEAEEAVPAGWFNYHLNLTGQWLGYLAGPSLTTWASHLLPEGDSAFATPMRAAVDAVTEDGTEAQYRYIIATHDTTGSCVLVSRRGQEWVLRRNFPGTPTDFLGATFAYFNAVVWSAGAIYYTFCDDPGHPTSGVGASALRDPGIDWTAATLPASPGTIRDVTGNTNNGSAVASTSTKILFSNDYGGTWADSGTTGRQSGRAIVVGLGAHVTGVEISSDAGDGYIVRTVNLLGAWAHVQTLTGTGSATSWRLAVGPTNDDGDVTFVAFKTGISNPNVHVSTDDGLTWTPVVTDAALQYLTSLAYRDGVWVATSIRAPFALTSSDLDHWTSLPVPIGEADADLYDVAYGSGAWLLVAVDRVLRGAPAVDPSPEGYSPNTSASALADAGALRGYRISTTAPTDGQALLYVSSTGRWTPATLPAAPTLPWSSAAAPATVQTTDATVTTLATIPTTTDKGLTLQVLVSATKSDRSAIVSWLWLVTITNVAGTVTVHDSLALGPTDPAAAHVDGTAPVVFDVSGTSVRVRVKGVAATTVDWSGARVSLLGS